MANRWRYIAEKNFDRLLKTLNLDASDPNGLGKDGKLDLIDRANGDFESDMVQRFEVPLRGAGGSTIDDAPQFTRQKVLNAIKAKVRQLVGEDQNRNIVVESTEKYIDVHKQAYNNHIKELLDAKRQFNLELQAYAKKAYEPPAEVAKARPDNTRDQELDEDETFLWWRFGR